MGSRRDVGKEFAEMTSAHGFMSILRNRGCGMKLLWTIFLLAAWTALSYQVCFAVANYFKYPINVNMKVKYLESRVFPAITFCNLNPLLRSRAANDSQLSTLMALLENGIGTNETKSINVDKTVISDEDLLRFLTSYYMYNLNLDMAYYGHQLEDMLLECTFQNEPCSAANFTRWSHGRYGNCYTFFVTKENFATSTGVDFGLSLTLFAQTDEYLQRISPAGGFKVVISAPEYVPFPSQQGFVASPGYLSSAAIQLTEFKRLPMPYDNTECGDDQTDNSGFVSAWKSIRAKKKLGPANYTNTACMRKCLTQLVFNKCGCVMSTMISREALESVFSTQVPDACNPAVQTEIECTRSAWQESTEEIGACMVSCPLPCNEKKFEAVVSGSVWPREEYFVQMIKQWNKEASLINAPLGSLSEVKNQLAAIEVHFDDLTFTLISEEKQMDVWSLLSSVGGTMGLYGGLSFLTLFEILEYLFRFITNRRAVKGKEEE